MVSLSIDVIKFFERQGCVLVATFSSDGSIHNSCKGIVRINKKGEVYIMDLYKAVTYNNLQKDHRISITAYNETKFTGYSLKGRAKILPESGITASLLDDWNKRLTSRIATRLLDNIKSNNSLARHHEAHLPKPNYLIVIQVDEVVDLAPKEVKI